MADEDDEDGADITAENLPKTHLFPIYINDNDNVHHQHSRAPLFPSATAVSNKNPESLDWLSNKSYQNIKVENNPPITRETNLDSARNIDSQHAFEEEYISNDDDDDEKYYKKRKLKKHKKHKRHKQEKIDSKDEIKLRNLPSTIWIEESGLEFDNAYRVHKKPDYDNISFGGLYRLDIARHKLNPKLRCLGVEHDDIFGHESKKKKTPKPERYWQQQVFPDSIVLLTKRDKNCGKASFGFSKNFSYVPLELPLSANKPQTSTCEEISEANDLRSQTKQLNTKVREEPSNIEAWLALADLQSKQVQHKDSSTTDSLSQSGVEKHRKLSKLRLEKKSSVLEQALLKNPTSVKLIIEHMNICVETLTGDVITEKWRNILFVQPQRTLLWKLYLMFCQAHFSSFTFSNTLAVYSKCFTTLAAIKDGTLKSHSAEENMEFGMLEIFMQYCQFLKQSGQTEKAVASFQALIEFNCFYPASIGDEISTASAIQFFESFWDSDFPRFGEVNSSGWRSYIENKPSEPLISITEIFPQGPQQETSTSELQETIIASASQRSQMWSNLEEMRTREHWKPKMATDENQEDLDEIEDPDRIVLFQDISSCLFKISDDNLRFQLVRYFLIFLGVADTADHMVSGNLLQVMLEDDKQLTQHGSGRFSCWWPNHHEMVPSTTNAGTNTTCTAVTPSRCMFIRNVFNQSLTVFQTKAHQSEIACLWLTFEKDVLRAIADKKQRKLCYKVVRKLAKALLKLPQYCNDLNVWMAFVRIEWTFGNKDEARRIVYSTLQQTVNVGEENVADEIYVFLRSYFELEMALNDSCGPGITKDNLDNQDIKTRIQATMAFVFKTGNITDFNATLTPSQVLKTQKALQEATNRLSAQQKHKWDSAKSLEERTEILKNFTICSCLFNYWSLGLGAARDTLDTFLAHIKQDTALSHSKCQADFLTFYTRLLQFHSKHGVCPVRPLRELLISALTSFPESSYFLNAYVELELKSCIATNVRRFFDRILPNTSTPLPWCFAVAYEKQRREAVLLSTGNTQGFSTEAYPVSGVVNRLRSLYEKAIVHPSTRNCIAIWRSYIHFEAENGDLHRAKAIFYQSLQCCAWAKILYCDAVKLFPELLEDLHDMLEEKELRIRFPLDELNLLIDDNITTK